MAGRLNLGRRGGASNFDSEIADLEATLSQLSPTPLPPLPPARHTPSVRSRGGSRSPGAARGVTVRLPQSARDAGVTPRGTPLAYNGRHARSGSAGGGRAGGVDFDVAALSPSQAWAAQQQQRHHEQGDGSTRSRAPATAASRRRFDFDLGSDRDFASVGAGGQAPTTGRRTPRRPARTPGSRRPHSRHSQAGAEGSGASVGSGTPPRSDSALPDAQAPLTPTTGMAAATADLQALLSRLNAGTDLPDEELAGVEEALLAKERAVEDAKRRLAAHKAAARRREIARAANELKATEDRISAARERRERLRDRVAALKAKQKKNSEDEVQASQALWDFQRDAHIEELARQRIMLKSLTTRRQEVADAVNRRMLELQEIEAERKRQAQRAERRLQDIIDKTEYLAEELKNGEWDERERQRIASNVVAQAKGEGDERFRLVDEIEVVRRQRRHKQQVEAAERLHKINQERMLLHDRERELMKKRRLIDALQQKGQEYLVEMELGNGPPLEYILQNLPDDLPNLQEDIEEADEDLDVAALVQDVQETFDDRVQNVERMRKERDDFLAHEAQFTNPTWSAEPYNGEYGIETVPLHLRDVWNMCADIVWDTVEEYLATMKSVQDVVQETANLRMRWKNQRDRIFRMVGEAEVLTSISGVVGELLDEVIADAAKEILGDLDYFKRLVFHTVTNMLIKASLTPLHKHGYDQMLRSTIGYAQHERLMRDTGLGSKGLPLHRHTQRFRYVKRRLAEPLSALADEQEKHRRERELERARRAAAEAGDTVEDDEDLEFLTLRMTDVEMLPVDADKSAPLNSLVPEEMVKAERAYWKSIDVIPRHIELTRSSRHITQVTCVAGSPFGDMLAAGTAYGAVGVFKLHSLHERQDRLRASPPPRLLYSYIPRRGAPITQIKWGVAGSSQLVAVDNDNHVHTFLIRPDWHGPILKKPSRTHKGSIVDSLFDKEDKIAADKLLKDLTIDQVALTRLEDGSEAVHKPLVVDWFPAFTMLGHQPAVMMGCTTGAIVKYNTHAGRHPGYLMYSRARQEAYGTAVAINEKHRARSKAAREAAASRAERRMSAVGRISVTAANAYDVATVDVKAGTPAHRNQDKLRLAAAAAHKVRRSSQVHTALAVQAMQAAAGVGDDDEDSDAPPSRGAGDDSSDTDESQVGVTKEEEDIVDDEELELQGDDRQQYTLADDFVLEKTPTLVGAPMTVAVLEPVNPKVKGDAERIAADRAHTGEGHATDATGGLNLEARRKRKFDLKLAVHGVQREYFIGHTEPILFLGFALLPGALLIPTAGPLQTDFQSSPNVVVITVDRSGKIMYWPYRKDNFSAFAWFTPGVRLRLDMQVPTFTENQEAEPTSVFPPPGVKMPSQPEKNPQYQRISKALMAPYKERTPFDVRAAGKNKQIVFAPADSMRDARAVDFDVLTVSPYGTLLAHDKVEYVPVVHEGRLLDVQMVASRRQLLFLVQYPAAPPNPATLRMAILDLATKSLTRLGLELPLVGTEVPRFAVSPVLTVTRSDYVFLMMDNVVRVLSLATGKPVVAPLSPLRSDETEESLVSLAVIGANEHLAVCGPDLDVLYLYQLVDKSTTQVRQQVYRMCTSHQRAKAVPSEQRVFGRLRRK